MESLFPTHRQIETQQCSGCKQLKPVYSFALKDETTGQRQPECRACLAVRSHKARLRKQTENGIGIKPLPEDTIEIDDIILPLSVSVYWPGFSGDGEPRPPISCLTCQLCEVCAVQVNYGAPACCERVAEYEGVAW